MLSMINGEEEFPLKSDWKRKPMLVFLMSHMHEIQKPKEIVIMIRTSIQNSGVLRLNSNSEETYIEVTR